MTEKISYKRSDGTKVVVNDYIRTIFKERENRRNYLKFGALFVILSVLSYASGVHIKNLFGNFLCLSFLLGAFGCLFTCLVYYGNIKYRTNPLLSNAFWANYNLSFGQTIINAFTLTIAFQFCIALINLLIWVPNSYFKLVVVTFLVMFGALGLIWLLLRLIYYQLVHLYIRYGDFDEK